VAQLRVNARLGAKTVLFILMIIHNRWPANLVFEIIGIMAQISNE